MSRCVAEEIYQCGFSSAETLFYVKNIIISNSTWHTLSSYIEFNDTIALEGTHFEVNRWNLKCRRLNREKTAHIKIGCFFIYCMQVIVTPFNYLYGNTALGGNIMPAIPTYTFPIFKNWAHASNWKRPN